MNLEEIYSEELHKQVTENQLELVWKSAEDTAYETFRVEQYTFYYENKIMNLVSQGDLELLKVVLQKWERETLQSYILQKSFMVFPIRQEHH